MCPRAPSAPRWHGLCKPGCATSSLAAVDYIGASYTATKRPPGRATRKYVPEEHFRNHKRRTGTGKVHISLPSLIPPSLPVAYTDLPQASTQHRPERARQLGHARRVSARSAPPTALKRVAAVRTRPCYSELHVWPAQSVLQSFLPVNRERNALRRRRPMGRRLQRRGSPRSPHRPSTRTRIPRGSGLGLQGCPWRGRSERARAQVQG